MTAAEVLAEALKGHRRRDGLYQPPNPDAQGPEGFAAAILAALPDPIKARVEAALTGEDSLDAAWAAVEAALPEGWELKLSVREDHDAFYTAIAGYAYSLRHYRANVGRARFTPFEMGHGPTPTLALRALEKKLREAQ